MLASAVVRVVEFSNRRPWSVILAAAVLAIVSTLYAVSHYAINTDAESLLPRSLPWRQSELALKATFPQRQLLVVVQAPTPELTEIATAKLNRELEARHDLFASVRRPNGGLFFERNALLFMPADQVAQTLQQLRSTGPLI